MNWKLICKLDDIPQLGSRVVQRQSGGDIAIFRNAEDEVFALHEIEGLSHEEISELTGAKVGTVRTRLHYAKRDFDALAKKRGLT